MIKNYGLKISEFPDEHAYVLGGALGLSKIVMRPDGDWTDFLPAYEPQFGADWDSSGCVIWGHQNAIETMLKQRTWDEYNFSERFNYIIGKVRPPGSDPHEQIELIRKYGLVDSKFLPMNKTNEEFIRPDPMTKELLGRGEKFIYEVKHEYVWQNSQTKEQRMDKIKECLQYSPLGVSVTAWYEENGIYVDNGEPNTHWCVLYGIDNKGYKIFDSYDHSHKILSFDHNIQVCKRYALEPRLIKKKGFWLWELLKRLFG